VYLRHTTRYAIFLDKAVKNAYAVMALTTPIHEVVGGYLTQDLQVALNAVLRYCPVLASEPEGRLAAIVDFTFNLGGGRLQTSTLRRRINQRDWAAAASELRRWVYGGGRVLPGLVLRREAEVQLLLAA
jgi:lysozyme